MNLRLPTAALNYLHHQQQTCNNHIVHFNCFTNGIKSKLPEVWIRDWPGGHEVVVVEDFDKSLDLGPLGDLLLAHGGGHLTGVAVDACDQSVAVRTVGRTVIDVLRRRNQQQRLKFTERDQIPATGSHFLQTSPHRGSRILQRAAKAAKKMQPSLQLF